MSEFLIFFYLGFWYLLNIRENSFMKRLSLDELRSCEINIMDEIFDFCRRHELRIYLFGGTLIGAVRHKGFIPWDDDIDLSMPRPDYERLIELRNIDDFPKNLKLYDCDNISTYCYPFIKIVDASTYVNENKDYENKEIGVWVDIFPMDGAPENEEDWKKLYKKLQKKFRLMNFSQYKFGKGTSIIKIILKTIPLILCKLKNANNRAREINNICKSINYNNSKYIGDLVGCYGLQERHLKEGYETVVKLSFEGKEYEAPSNYEYYLKTRYGDYLTLPPENERITHGIEAYYID